MLKYFLVISLCVYLSLTNTARAESEEVYWWSGFSITPGIGFRHLGVDVIRHSDGYHGNISNAGFAQMVFTLNMVFNDFQLDEDGRVYLELNSYTSMISLDHQFYEMTSVGDTNYGERVDVGTELSGTYTYLMPSIKYAIKLAHGGEMSASLGIGFWNSNFKGNMIFTPDGRPSAGMPASDLSINTVDEIAYLVNLKWETGSGWIYMMSVGGASFSDETYKYEMEEVSMIIGKTIIF